MTVNWKKKLLPNLPYLLFVYLFDKLCQAVRLAPGLDASEKFLHLSQGFTEAFSSGLPSLHPLDLLAGLTCAWVLLVRWLSGSSCTARARTPRSTARERNTVLPGGVHNFKCK
jgi:type IV secretion system protein VirD4